MIRRAGVSDMPALLGMATKFHAISPWARLTFCAPKVEESLHIALSSDAMAVFITEDSQAMIAVSISPVFFSDVAIAQELVWWSERPGHGRALLQAIEAWAVEKGAHMLSLARLSGIADDMMDRMYRRRGFAPTEIFYAKRLETCP